MLCLCSCLSPAWPGESPPHHSRAQCFYGPWLALEQHKSQNACELTTLRFWPEFYLRTLSPQYYEDKVYALADKAQARLMNMDLEDVFSLLPEKAPSNRAHLCLQGDQLLSQHFQVHFSPYQKQLDHPNNFGDFIFYFGLQREDGARKQYFPDLHLAANVGPHSLSVLHEVWHSHLKILAQLDGPQILQNLRQDFPTSMALLERHLLIALSVQGETRKIFNLELKLKSESWHSSFPKVEKYLWRLSDVLWGKVILMGEGERPWAEFEMDTRALTFRSKFAFGAEGFFPLIGEPGKAWKIGQDSFSGYLVADLAMKVQGVKPIIQGHKIPLSYHPLQKTDQVSLTAGEKPTVKVEANFFTYVPVAFAKIFMGLEADIHRFFMELGESRNGGKGQLTVTLADVGAENLQHKALLSVDGNSKISNNLFIKLGFQMMAYRLIPDGETKNEWHRWGTEYLNAVISDIHQFSTLCKGRMHEKN
ncbi:MAG: hypothetical protein A2X86_02570 [Bdellovibrionales bacterium GWA2_49_15]|nr:MAG: hypothetical protein A2X86_02570 [Bdellovibrionales bacterium GWA2_49_15]HAZ14178.1 hypothetical protein [Bdellovibrionales bacterium]